MMSQVQSQSDLSGQRLGHYKLIRRIGRGGFGDVYEAQDINLRRRVVIKVLRRGLAKDEQRRFRREARIAARFKHQHIVRVLDFGIHQGIIPYIVMEYASKGSLRELYPKGKHLPLPIVLELLRPVAEALDYLHRHGCIHQDIKLENILLDEDWNVLLCDFGIAAIIREALQSETLLCTPTHTAPERFSENYVPSPSVDLYAMGIVVYELLTGYPPFQGSDFVAQHLYDAPPPLRSFVPDIPEEVEAVILKALAKRPEDRFGSIQEFFDKLWNAYEQSLDAESVTSSVANEHSPSTLTGDQELAATAFAVVSYLFATTLPVMFAYLVGLGVDGIWTTFALSVLIIPTIGVCIRPNRLARITVLIVLAAASIFGFVSQDIVLAGLVQFILLAFYAMIVIVQLLLS